MVEKDNIKDLFAQKLGQHEVLVRPELWQGIAFQVATPSIVGGGLSLGAKVAIGIGVVASLTGGILFFTQESSPKQKTEIVQVPVEKPVESTTEKTEVIIESSTTSESIVTPIAKEIDQPITEVTRPDYIQDYVDYLEVPTELIREIPVIQPQEAKQYQEEVPTIVEESKGNPIVEKEITALTVEKEEPLVLAEITKVPNIFTPNGDRDNDEFFIEYSGELEDYQVVIMNTSNQVIYQTTNPDFKWNGTTISGEQVAVGTYYFILTARDKNQNPINKYGQITVRR